MCKHLGVVLLSTSLLWACGDDGGEEEVDGNLDPNATFVVSGTVLDLESGAAVDGTATIVVDGIAAPPVTVDGAEFSFEVLANSTFHVLAGSPPDYRSTFNTAIEVKGEDVTSLELFVVREAFFQQLATDFGVTLTGDRGAMIVRTVDDAGAPVAGVVADVFAIPEGAAGPYFLDGSLAAAPEATETSASGLVLFFEVEPGLLTLGSEPDSGSAITAPAARVEATAISYLEAVFFEDAEEAEAELPTDVSFSADIAPMFLERGCVACHNGGGAGKDLGGLHLNGALNKMHKELAEEISPNYGVVRVDMETPENSLMLTKPSPEEPPDGHLTTFTGPNDPDYLLILVWIQEGALNN